MTENPLAIGTDCRERDASIDALVVDKAIPVIETVIRRRCRSWRNDREDIRSEVLVRLLRRLRELSSGPAAPVLDNFEGYVARIASRVVDDTIRLARPEWTRLKNRVRYLVTHDERFSLATHDDDDAVVSLAPRSTQQSRMRLRTAAAERLARELIAVLRSHGDPLRLDDLVGALADRTGLSEPVMVPESRAVLVSAQTAGTAVETTQILLRLWDEIVVLPRRQRIALLLSARDSGGESVLRLLLVTRLIQPAAVAATLEIDASELASLLREAPLPDAAIAVRLEATVQQVINLRKAARDRLARRIARSR